MDIISRLPGCDGQAADAVSAQPKWKWKMLTNYWKKQNRSVQEFGFVYHDTNGQNHGPVLKTQLFLLNGICTVILWHDCCGKGEFEKVLLSMAGRKFQIGNVSLHIVKRIIRICVCGWHKIGWKKTKSWSDVQRSRFWESQHLSSIMYTWDELKDDAKYAKILLTITEPCSNREFPREGQKNCHSLKMFVFLDDLMIWRVMQRNMWSENTI